MKQNKTLKNKVYKAYCDGDSEAAYRIAEDSGKTVIEYCKACDTERPTLKDEHECMFCGQATTPIQEDDKGILPPHIHRQFIEAAKKYSSNGTENVTVNAPDTYKVFRAGQDSAFSILKAQNKSLQIEEDSKHTPGPWYLSPNNTYVRAEGVHGWNIATIEDQPPYTKANAELIASAPQLKAENEALKEANKELLEAYKVSENKICELYRRLIHELSQNPTFNGKRVFEEQSEYIKTVTEPTIAKHSPKQ